MNKFAFVVLIIALISTGCATQNAANAQVLTESPNKTPTSQPIIQSEVCSNLLDEYSGSDKKPELVVYEKSSYKTYPITQVDEAITHYLSNKQSGQPLVLYVHGRALEDTKIGEYDREPDESKRDVIPAFSSKYNANTILMLHWPHKKPENKFPEGDAKFAGKALICVIQRLNSESFNVGKFPGFRALITHSMGALVLEEALDKSSESLNGFDVVSIFAAASKADHANSWLSKISAHKQYVLINTKDIVLGQVKDITKSVPLGMCDSKCFQKNQSAKNVIYLDITDIAGAFHRRHNYFVEGDVADKIVTEILKGESPPMGIKGVAENHRIIRKQDI